MRVTKTVREYIERQVKAKKEKEIQPYKQAERRDIQAIKDLVENFKIEVAELNTKYLNAIEEIGVGHWNYRKDKVEHIISLETPLMLKSEKKLNEVKSRMHREVEDICFNIIAELELGGNKADLERMISEI